MKTVLQVFVLLVLSFILFFLFYNALTPHKYVDDQNTFCDKIVKDDSAPKQAEADNIKIQDSELIKNPAIISDKIAIDKSATIEPKMINPKMKHLLQMHYLKMQFPIPKKVPKN